MKYTTPNPTRQDKAVKMSARSTPVVQPPNHHPKGFTMSKALEESNERWIQRFHDASDTMIKIRSEIHNLQIEQEYLSPEFNMLADLYNKANVLIDQFHSIPTEKDNGKPVGTD